MEQSRPLDEVDRLAGRDEIEVAMTVEMMLRELSELECRECSPQPVDFDAEVAGILAMSLNHFSGTRGINQDDWSNDDGIANFVFSPIVMEDNAMHSYSDEDPDEGLYIHTLTEFTQRHHRLQDPVIHMNSPTLAVVPQVPYLIEEKKRPNKNDDDDSNDAADKKTTLINNNDSYHHGESNIINEPLELENGDSWDYESDGDVSSVDLSAELKTRPVAESCRNLLEMSLERKIIEELSKRSPVARRKNKTPRKISFECFCKFCKLVKQTTKKVFPNSCSELRFKIHALEVLYEASKAL